MNRKQISQTKGSRSKNLVQKPNLSQGTKLILESSKQIAPDEQQVITTQAATPTKSVYQQYCFKKDFIMIPHLASLIYCKQNIKKVYVKSFEYNILKLTSFSRIGYRYQKMTFKSMSDACQYCKSITWKDTLQLRQPRFLNKILRQSSLDSFDLELHTSKFGSINLHAFKKMLKNLPKSLKSIKISLINYHPTLPEALESFYAEIVKLPYLEKIEIVYDPLATPTDLRLPQLYRALHRNKNLKEIILGPVLLASFLDSPDNESKLNYLTQLKPFTQFGVILDERILASLSKAAQLLTKLNSLRNILINAVFGNDFGPIMFSLTSLTNLEELHMKMIHVPIPLDELVNLPNLKRVYFEYNLVDKWSQKRFERDVEVLTFIDKLESLELNFVGCRLANVKYLGVCLGRIKSLRTLKLVLNQTYSRDCMSEFFKAMKSESVNLQDFSISMIFSEQKELDTLIAMLKKFKKLQSFALIVLEDIKDNKIAFRPEDLIKLCDGLSSSKDKLKKIHLQINKCEDFSEKKSITILSEFFKTLRNIEEIDVNMGKRYFTDTEIKAIFAWILEVDKLNKLKIEGDFSMITQKVFQFVVDCIKASFHKKDIQVMTKGYTKGNLFELSGIMDSSLIKKMF